MLEEEGGGGGVGTEEHKPGVDGGSKKEETRKCRVEDPAVLLPLLGFTLICSSAHWIVFFVIVSCTIWKSLLSG